MSRSKTEEIIGKGNLPLDKDDKNSIRKKMLQDFSITSKIDSSAKTQGRARTRLCYTKLSYPFMPDLRQNYTRPVVNYGYEE